MTPGWRDGRRGGRGPMAPRASLVPPPGVALGLAVPVGRAAMAAVSRRCLDPGLPWPVQRRRLAAAARLAPAWPRPAVARSEVAGVPVDMVEPAEASGGSHATVVHFHGGGYCVGEPRMAWSVAGSVAQGTGLPVVLPRYRLAPEHRFPAAVDDAVAVLGALAERGPVVAAGDSAGAGLALAATLRLRDDGGPLPVGLVLHCPWVDLTADLAPADPTAPRGPRRAGDPSLVRRDVVLRPAWLAACAAAYVGAGDSADPLVSPRWAELAGLPPMVVQAAGDDLLCPDAVALAGAVRAAGSPVSLSLTPGLWHDFGLQPGLLPAATTAAAQVVASVRRWTGMVTASR